MLCIRAKNAYNVNTNINLRILEKTLQEGMCRLSPIKSTMFEKPPSEEPEPPGKIRFINENSLAQARALLFCDVSFEVLNVFVGLVLENWRDFFEAENVKERRRLKEFQSGGQIQELPPIQYTAPRPVLVQGDPGVRLVQSVTVSSPRVSYNCLCCSLEYYGCEQYNWYTGYTLYLCLH